MTRFFEEITDIDKEKYIKDIQKNIDLEKYTKIKDFFYNNNLYITNIKVGPLKYLGEKVVTILDNSKNKWFIQCNDGKIILMAKKNTIIHTKDIKYTKRDASFSKKYKIKKADYLIEYVDSIGANLSLCINNYNDIIGKNKWSDDSNFEIKRMTLHSQTNSSINGYTYNGDDFSLCSVGKNYNKENDILL